MVMLRIHRLFTPSRAVDILPADSLSPPQPTTFELPRPMLDCFDNDLALLNPVVDHSVFKYGLSDTRMHMGRRAREWEPGKILNMPHQSLAKRISRLRTILLDVVENIFQVVRGT